MTDEERKQFINEYCRNVGNTKIRCDDCKFQENCVDYGWKDCKKFTPKQSEPMTNEEWFASLPTEEKAKWMAKHMSFCEVCEIQTCRGDGCQRFDRGSMTETDAFREWLEETHNE